MLLVATAMAVLLAGCGSSSQSGDQGSSQGSEQEEGSTQQTSEAMTNEQTSEPTTNETVVGRCADSGGTEGQQEQASGGEGFNGKIAFTLNSDIYVVDGEGAHESRLTHTAQVFEQDPVWSPDGKKIAFITPDSTPGEEKSALCVMNADGTNKTQLAEDVWTKPSWSPDGKKIAFTTQDQSDLSVINVDGTKKVSLITTAFAGNAENRTGFESPVWSPTGNKIAFSSSTYEEGYASSSASASAASFTEKGLTGIYLINVDGTGLSKVTNTETGVSRLVWSPDGEQIAFYDSDTMGDPTYVINTDGSGRKPLGESYSAVWSPDGQKIAFVTDSNLPNVWLLHVMNADGSGQRRLTNTIRGTLTLPAWSPDGEKIAFPCSADPGGENADLCVINAGDGTEWKRIALNVGAAGSLMEVSWGRG
jgi:Tol biopolymer transport system component